MLRVCEVTQKYAQRFNLLKANINLVLIFRKQIYKLNINFDFLSHSLFLLFPQKSWYLT